MRGLMPKLKEVDITYRQIADLVSQLEFEEKMSLIKTVVCEKDYRDNFYNYTEKLRKKHHIPMMNEEELDSFLHQ